MTWLKRSSIASILAVSLTLGIVSHGSAQIQINQSVTSLSNSLPTTWEMKFRPPVGRGNPDGREGGATRGPECLPKNKKLIALVPPSGFGTTASKYPTLFWYLPATSARSMQFTLLDKNEQKVYSTKFMISGNPGILSLQIPQFASLQPLQAGQQYTWELSLLCNQNDNFTNISLNGSIQRIEDNKIVNKIKNLSPQNQVAIYAEAGVWYDTVASLIELRRVNPHNPNLNNAWLKLLKSAKLDTVVQELGI